MSCLVFNSCEFGQLLRVRIITSTWSRHSKTSKTFKLYRSCCCCDIISIIKIPNVDSFQARSASQFTGKFSLGEINLSDSNSKLILVRRSLFDQMTNVSIPKGNSYCEAAKLPGQRQHASVCLPLGCHRLKTHATHTCVAPPLTPQQVTWA